MFDGIEMKLRKLEECVDISAYDFVDDEERKGKESAVGGLANVTDISKKLSSIFVTFFMMCL